MTLKRGFEIYYFDGTGSKPMGPLDFEEFMNILGELDGTANAGPDDGIRNQPQGVLPFSEESPLPDRESPKRKNTGASQETPEGAS